MGKKEAGEEKRQATDFGETERCPSAVLQRAARRKNDWISRVPGTSVTIGKVNRNI